MNVTEITEKKPNGSYVGMNLDSQSVKKLLSFAKNNNIPNPLKASDFHTTLLYSRKYLPNYIPLGKLPKPIEAQAESFEIWDSPANAFKDNDTRCLVLKLSCPEQVDRFNYLMVTHDATYDFNEYKPHITMSYDVGDDFSLDDIPKDLTALNPLFFDEEYGEDL